MKIIPDGIDTTLWGNEGIYFKTDTIEITNAELDEIYDSYGDYTETYLTFSEWFNLMIAIKRMLTK